MNSILGRYYVLVSSDGIMTEYPGTPLWPRILGRHYDLVSWDAILNSYPGTPL